MARTRSPLHRAAALTLALILALSNGGCFSAHHQRLKAGAPLENAIGLTTRSGRDIPFAMPGATIEHDTLVAVGSAGELRIPTDSVARITKRGFSPARTGILIATSLIVLSAVAVIANCCEPVIP
jgi:hypothetical protein